MAPSPWWGIDIVSLIAVTWPRAMCDATLMMVSCCHDVTLSRRHVELQTNLREVRSFAIEENDPTKGPGHMGWLAKILKTDSAV